MSDALDELDRHLRSLAANDALSGVVLFSRGGRSVFEGAYGWASRTWRVPMTLDMRFDCASVTKLFTTVATLQRVDAGDFDLDTSAIDYLGLEGTAISPAGRPLGPAAISSRRTPRRVSWESAAKTCEAALISTFPV